jgi:hypothetical protein
MMTDHRDKTLLFFYKRYLAMTRNLSLSKQSNKYNEYRTLLMLEIKETFGPILRGNNE